MAGTNGAGKSSILGAAVSESGGSYFNPDEYAKNLRLQSPSLGIEDANSQAWNLGRQALREAIATQRDFALETTLGGNTLTGLLIEAALSGMLVRVSYVGLESPELHIARVASRVREGGHDIPTHKVRERYETSRRNLIRLIPHLTELRVFDNSIEGSPAKASPRPALVLHYLEGKVLFPQSTGDSPAWAQEIVAAAWLQQDSR